MAPWATHSLLLRLLLLRNITTRIIIFGISISQEGTRARTHTFHMSVEREIPQQQQQAQPEQQLRKREREKKKIFGYLNNGSVIRSSFLSRYPFRAWHSRRPAVFLYEPESFKTWRRRMTISVAPSSDIPMNLVFFLLLLIHISISSYSHGDESKQIRQSGSTWNYTLVLFSLSLSLPLCSLSFPPPRP